MCVYFKILRLKLCIVEEFMEDLEEELHVLSFEGNFSRVFSNLIFNV